MISGLTNPCEPYKSLGVPIWLRISEPVLYLAPVKRLNNPGGSKRDIAVVAWDGNGKIMHFKSKLKAAIHANMADRNVNDSMRLGHKRHGYYWLPEISIK